MKEQHVPIDAAGGSRKGVGRRCNEDRFLVETMADSMLLAVSDGMGGHPAGDIAAADILRSLTNWPKERFHPLPFLIDAVARAESTILGRVAQNTDLTGMGATVTAAIIQARKIFWVHVGDTRLYLLRDGQLQQITRDHSFLQDFIDDGTYTPQQAAEHPMAHMLDQCVGCADTVPDSGSFSLAAGDILLLCSDGVYRPLGEAEMGALLSPAREAVDQIDNLLEAAVRAGSRDDVTAVVAVT
ncbi:PP2C family protein-serine/threonine phosphatase [Desulfofustis glycolicus]|nr:protein phosphatase 2C domain-containing protein [Desulfofustis glycolicus]MCB2215001.1 protein phosphatase 2C domain-containing protein [Desulfobulbaceae bacterium]